MGQPGRTAQHGASCPARRQREPGRLAPIPFPRTTRHWAPPPGGSRRDGQARSRGEVTTRWPSGRSGPYPNPRRLAAGRVRLPVVRRGSRTAGTHLRDRPEAPDTAATVGPPGGAERPHIAPDRPTPPEQPEPGTTTLVEQPDRDGPAAGGSCWLGGCRHLHRLRLPPALPPGALNHQTVTRSCLMSLSSLRSNRPQSPCALLGRAGRSCGRPVRSGVVARLVVARPLHRLALARRWRGVGQAYAASRTVPVC
jgi:hypothetical protein